MNKLFFGKKKKKERKYQDFELYNIPSTNICPKSDKLKKHTSIAYKHAYTLKEIYLVFNNRIRIGFNM